MTLPQYQHSNQSLDQRLRKAAQLQAQPPCAACGDERAPFGDAQGRTLCHPCWKAQDGLPEHDNEPCGADCEVCHGKWDGKYRHPKKLK